MESKKRFLTSWVTRLLALACLVFGVQSMAQTVYYHADALGSPIAATDDNGNLLWREQYKPFGERIRNEQAAQGNRLWYTGAAHDGESGLTYLGARYYDPVVGRFMGMDPVGFTEKVPSSFNRYGYAANNPYSYSDPDGEFLNFVIGGIKGAVENVIIQNLEIQLGLRDEFSYGELAFDTALGGATSGLSGVKTTARIASLAAKARQSRAAAAAR